MKVTIQIDFESADKSDFDPYALKRLVQTWLKQTRENLASSNKVKNIRANINSISDKEVKQQIVDPERAPDEPPMRYFYNCCFACGRPSVSKEYMILNDLEQVASRNGDILVCRPHIYGGACRELVEKYISYLIHVKGYQNFPVDYRANDYK